MSAASAVRILLVDDHALFREGLGRLLEAEPGLHLVATCATLDEAVTVLRNTAIDLVLLDIDLGRESGVEFFERARQTGYGGKVLAVTAGVDHRAASLLLAEGVCGVFHKHNSPETLVECIHRVMSGEFWLQEVSWERGSTAPPSPPGLSASPALTDRERQVLSGVFEGLGNKEIAGRLGMSESSVKGILQQLFSKTGVRTRSQLVRIALEQYRDGL
jgi:DNA-binding NarL/FixJ family response regulator